MKMSLGVFTLSEIMDAPTEAVCYLCLDGEVNENSQPLRRDCACRGLDAGFVHLSCLTKYAAVKSEQARDMKELREPWKFCLNCNQQYQNDFGIDIATEFVSFVKRIHPRDTQMQVEALDLKLCALINMIDCLQPRQMREAGVTANVMLSLIDRMKVVVSPLPRRYSQFEADSHNAHGCIALNEGTEDGARRAVVHFNKDLNLCEAIGDVEGIAVAKGSIAAAKSRLFEGGNIEEVLKASEELYELRVAKLGEEHEHTIHAGKQYADALQRANRGGDASELLMKLLATSKQVLGPHHSITMTVEAALNKCR